MVVSLPLRISNVTKGGDKRKRSSESEATLEQAPSAAPSGAPTAAPKASKARQRKGKEREASPSRQ